MYIALTLPINHLFTKQNLPQVMLLLGMKIKNLFNIVVLVKTQCVGSSVGRAATGENGQMSFWVGTLKTGHSMGELEKSYGWDEDWEVMDACW